MFISTTVYLWSSNLAGWLNAKRSFLLSCGSSDFDFCYMIWRFRTQSHYRLVALLLLLLLRRNLSGISGICNKKYFAGQQTANTLQLFVAVKWNFSGLFFFWTSLKERKFPRNYLINAATSLFVSRKENFPETAW